MFLIGGGSHKLDNIPQLTLSQLQDLLKTDQEIRDDKLNKLLE